MTTEWKSQHELGLESDKRGANFGRWEDCPLGPADADVPARYWDQARFARLWTYLDGAEVIVNVTLAHPVFEG